MRPQVFTHALTAVLLFVACASVESLRGASGPVAWEIVDLRTERDTERREFIWRYTLVLRETNGVGIRFTKIHSSMFEPGRPAFPVVET